MINFQQLRIALTLISTQILLAHVALELLYKQSPDNVNKLVGNSTTLLIVAHPDDETMFFGPTIINILANNNSLIILCLSNGDFENLGEQREQEFSNVTRALGSNVTLKVIKDSLLPDNIAIDWNVHNVARHIEKQITSYEGQIGTIITFDSYGVSGHSNHRSIFEASKHLKNELNLNIDFYVLKSLTLVRKYSSFLDAIVTFMLDYTKIVTQNKDLIMAINLSEYSNLKQILQLHRSQMVWFRQLYMMFSRYMFINNLEYLD